MLAHQHNEARVLITLQLPLREQYGIFYLTGSSCLVIPTIYIPLKNEEVSECSATDVIDAHDLAERCLNIRAEDTKKIL